MSLTAEQALAASKKYTQESLEGAGALKGDDGKSAYELAVEQGFEGTLDEWLDSLQGEDGQPGATGPAGPQGPKGQDGTVSFDELTPEQKAELKGDKGDKGDTGEQGPQGLQGQTGPQGEQGIQGIQGEKGDIGDTGPKGDTGDAGPGVAKGGTAGQVLRKKSGTDYDTEWVDDGITDTEFQSIQVVLGTNE